MFTAHALSPPSTPIHITYTQLFIYLNSQTIREVALIAGLNSPHELTANRGTEQTAGLSAKRPQIENGLSGYK